MAEPENVRIYRPDTDDEVHCELVHEGVDDLGMDNWAVVDEQFRVGVDSLRIGKLPAKTSISVAARKPEPEPEQGQ